MKRIYVAGPYSADNVIDVLKNIGRGQKACSYLFSVGFAPFCPWHDRIFITDRPEGKFTVSQFYDYSMAWLKVSDAVVLLPGWKNSVGTIAEIKEAKKRSIPVFESIAGLIRDWGHLVW